MGGARRARSWLRHLWSQIVLRARLAQAARLLTIGPGRGPRSCLDQAEKGTPFWPPQTTAIPFLSQVGKLRGSPLHSGRWPAEGNLGPAVSAGQHPNGSRFWAGDEPNRGSRAPCPGLARAHLSLPKARRDGAFCALAALTNC